MVFFSFFPPFLFSPFTPILSQFPLQYLQRHCCVVHPRVHSTDFTPPFFFLDFTSSHLLYIYIYIFLYDLCARGAHSFLLQKLTKKKKICQKKKIWLPNFSLILGRGDKGFVNLCEFSWEKKKTPNHPRCHKNILPLNETQKKAKNKEYKT